MLQWRLFFALKGHRDDIVLAHDRHMSDEVTAAGCRPDLKYVADQKKKKTRYCNACCNEDDPVASETVLRSRRLRQLHKVAAKGESWAARLFGTAARAASIGFYLGLGPFCWLHWFFLLAVGQSSCP